MLKREGMDSTPSYQTAVKEKMKAKTLFDIPIDLMIVDEAHVVRKDNWLNVALHRLGRSASTVLMTATPCLTTPIVSTINAHNIEYDWFELKMDARIYCTLGR